MSDVYRQPWERLPEGPKPQGRPEYTPTVEHARAQYARHENYDEYYEGDLYLTPDGQLSAAEFDRMIAAVERGAAAKALRAAKAAADQMWRNGGVVNGAELRLALQAAVSAVTTTNPTLPDSGSEQ